MQGILDGLLQSGSDSGAQTAAAAREEVQPALPSRSIEERMTALLEKIKGMTGQDAARRDLLAALSDEEWETYRRLRRADDERLLADFEAQAHRVPDVVHRIITRTRLRVGTPVAECDAEAARRQSN